MTADLTLEKMQAIRQQSLGFSVLQVCQAEVLYQRKDILKMKGKWGCFLQVQKSWTVSHQQTGVMGHVKGIVLSNRKMMPDGIIKSEDWNANCMEADKTGILTTHQKAGGIERGESLKLYRHEISSWLSWPLYHFHCTLNPWFLSSKKENSSVSMDCWMMS